MEMLLLGTTVISLAVALVMSTAAWRLTQEERRRSAARVAALSVAASDSGSAPAVAAHVEPRVEGQPVKAPWKGAAFETAEPVRPKAIAITAPEPELFDQSAANASGFLGAAPDARDGDGRQRSLAFAAAALVVVLAGGLAWMMSEPEGTTAVAVGPNSPLELMSLSHARQNEKLAVSGLVRNPATGKPVERLAAVVFLFDRMGTFVTSAKAEVDFLRLGAGDESPFVVSLNAPRDVTRYRVSFRTDDGVVPHVDRRGAALTPADGEQAVSVNLK
jgi:hypothetical protein